MGKWIFIVLCMCMALAHCMIPSKDDITISDNMKELMMNVSCTECTAATDLARYLVFANASETEYVKLLVSFCVHFNIENVTVCDGIVDMFKDEFLFVLKSEVSSENICGYFFEVCPFPNVTYFNVTFPKPKPPHVTPAIPNPADPKLRILHISDVHFDVNYVEGTDNKCGEPLCCRAVNGQANGTRAAGKWGDYQCDLNSLLLNNLISHFASLDPKPDAVFWTGDNPPHDIWMQTQQGQINNSAYLAQALKSAFGDIPVYPCIGNHEGVPVNSYPLPPYSSWLYDALGEQWSVWLSAGAVASFEYGGYYVADMFPGIKVVSLNMNYCNSGNGWLYLNNSDPGQILQWLINVLQTAEDNMEKVYLIGHIPPGNHVCLPQWGYQFYQIVDRYEDTILSQFYGHTHNDQFEVFYELNGTRATSVAYIAPSVTTYQNNNPSYRIYTVDAKTGYVVESSTYHTNMSKANEMDNPVWELEYNATSAYNLSSLFPSAWDDLIARFDSDDDLFQLYYVYHNSGGPRKEERCTSLCKKSQVCQAQSGTSHLLHQCTDSFGIQRDQIQLYHNC